METIVGQRPDTSREILPPFLLPYAFSRRRWWHQSARQETVAELVLALVTLSMVGGMLWGFFQALHQWQLGM